MGLEGRQGFAAGSGRRAAGRFGAAGTSLGFQYQIRYALLLLLRAEDDDSMTMEKSDDIALERDESTGELIQTKHHTRPEPIGDTSRDLWKTLRNWSVSVRQGSLEPSGHALTLVTTSKVREGTAASMLQPEESGKRNAPRALDLLRKIALRGEPASIEGHCAEFARLEVDEQRRLLDSVNILGCEPDVAGVADSIKRELRMVSPQGRLDEFAERVEGWWFNCAIDSMRSGTPVRRADLKARIDDIRNQFTTENLPLDFATAPLPPGELAAARTFVRQLEIIGVSAKRQNAARLDFYRAASQRSKWVGDDLVMIGELPEYDKRLTEHWSDTFHRMKEDLEDVDDEKTLRDRGRAQYSEAIYMGEKIRPGAVLNDYVMRGSLHLLADKPEIGWHPNYDAMLAPRPAGAGAAK